MKITVAVPTINGRSAYLHACLQTCVAQNEDFEILVSDNPGGDAREVVESFGDRRIRYIRPPRYLPMSAHWDFVLGEVRGDILTFIGDDDGLMPQCIQRVKKLALECGDLPIHHSFANYCWPDFVTSLKRNTVTFEHPSGEGHKLVSSNEFLESIAKGSARYVDGPMVYHNFVPKKLLQNLTVNGVFFRRSSPDLYSALAIAANVPSFISTKEILTLSGQGAKANGASIQSGSGHQFLSEVKSLYPPRYAGRSIQMALLDSLIDVAENFDRPALLESIDYAAHFAAAIREARWMAPNTKMNELKLVLAAAGRHGVRIQTLTATANSVFQRLLVQKIASKPKSKYQRGQVLEMPAETTTIFDAVQNLDKFLKNAVHE